MTKVMDFKQLIEDQLSRIENVKPVQIIDISELKIDTSKSISLYPNVEKILIILLKITFKLNLYIER